MPETPEDKREDARSSLVSIPDMPDRLEAAGVKRVSATRIRQLQANDPDFPEPAIAHRRLRLWEWGAVLHYFRNRVPRQGERTDLNKPD
ncbi:hypothetical protein SUDANB1_05617 [Streptomyces sp. enrichment culture]|uniref:hypothetical protein n=1 Tax=Streptomyces sp. enrichment culture TaxID=1795815 RepID=UPI003F57677F